MPRRTVLTARQRDALFALPDDEATLMRQHILSERDLEHVRRRRRAHNRLGFALQLCAFRYPGRLLQPGEVIPHSMLNFVGAQIGVEGEELIVYGEREATRYQHSTSLQRLYGYRPFEGRARDEIAEWIGTAAEAARANEDLAAGLLDEMRRRFIIVPGPTTVERLCAEALVAAERRIAERIADRLPEPERRRLLSLLAETIDDRMTLFVWLRRHEAGSNSAAANRLLDRLDVLKELNIPPGLLMDVPAHRVARLRRQGERYYADGLRELPDQRRLAILAVCAIEWHASVVDVLVETHDRIVGKLYRSAERVCNDRIADQRTAVGRTLRSFADVGGAILRAHESGGDPTAGVETTLGWPAFADLVRTAGELTSTLALDPLDFVGMGYPRFRLYTPRLLAALNLRSGPAALPLLDAIDVLRKLNSAGDTSLPAHATLAFARQKWRKRLNGTGSPVLDRRTWETALLFALREALRSGDVWLTTSKRHRDVTGDLVPLAAIGSSARLAVPLSATAWLSERRSTLEQALASTARAAMRGLLPNGTIDGGELHLERLEAAGPAGADDLVLALYGAIPQTRITDLLLAVDAATGFTDAFTDLRTGSPCQDKIGLLSVILADGINLGLKKMAASTGSHTHWQLLRIARWHVEHDAYDRALAILVAAQGQLPMARLWGEGLTSSSDGQFFPAGGTGEAMNLVNARYGNTPGLKAYSHLSDQFAPFAVRTIPATAHEAPFILDGLTGTEAGQRITEHYADTGGFTDHVFAVCSTLGYAFAPRIKDLPHKRLYTFEPATAPPALRPLIAGRIRTELIERNWPGILRLSASMSLGTVVPSQMLRKLASYPRQNELAAALREVGRVERTLFMLRWITDTGLQRRAQMGLNKGEAHHSLKRAISFNRRGEIRDRTSEGQHHRMAGLNLLAAIIIHWNTREIGRVVGELDHRGECPDPALLSHVSPLGWEHINLNGEYRWPSLG